MSTVRFDYSNALSFVGEHEVDQLQETVKAMHSVIHDRSGAGSDFLGWVDLPTNYDTDEFARIKAAAERIRENSDVLVVVGIGGSYLGARAAIEMLQHSFFNVLSKEERNAPQVFFAGHNISSTYLTELLQVLEGKDVSVNVI